MKRIKSVIIFTSVLMFMCPALDAGQSAVTIFTAQTDIVGWKASVKGKVISISSRMEYEDEELTDYARIKSMATVRINDSSGIKTGDVLYVINDKNLIVSKMKVRTIIPSVSMGYLLVGYGNFMNASVQDRVVSRVLKGNSKYAAVHKARGDYYRETGSEGNAISEYKKSIEYDHNCPEAHYALGAIYYRLGMNRFALIEYDEAYKNIKRIYDNEDRFVLLKGMAEVRMKEVFESPVPEKIKNKFRQEGIQFSKEALRVYPDSVDVNYILGMFYFRNPEPADKKARDCFLKTVQEMPAHTGANIALSELYFKHRNREKARFYALAALAADPSNARARELIDYIENFNRK